MSEAQWLAATDPRSLLRFARRPGELRHFAVACVRAAGFGDWRGLFPRWPEVLDTADRLASGTATPGEGNAVLSWSQRFYIGMTLGEDLDKEDEFMIQCHLLEEPFTRREAEGVAFFGLCDGRLKKVLAAGRLIPGESWEHHLRFGTIPRWEEWLSRPAAFARDITGNPYRSVAFHPSWRTSTVVALADGIYREQAFDRLPILADALMDSGCDRDDIMSHCRSDGPHVRGCWAVELVLGRSAPASPGLLRLVGMTEGFEGREWTFFDPFEVGRHRGCFRADAPGKLAQPPPRRRVPRRRRVVGRRPGKHQRHLPQRHPARRAARRAAPGG